MKTPYTIVNQKERKELGLSVLEYCVWDFVKKGEDFRALGVSKKTIKRVKKKLRGLDLLKRFQSPQELVEAIKNKKLEKNYICEWCKEKVISIIEHHYPRSAKRGNEIVRICPNCHTFFHSYFRNL